MKVIILHSLSLDSNLFYEIFIVHRCLYVLIESRHLDLIVCSAENGKKQYGRRNKSITFDKRNLFQSSLACFLNDRESL